jgi:hypothetical protein
MPRNCLDEVLETERLDSSYILYARSNREMGRVGCNAVSFAQEGYRRGLRIVDVEVCMPYSGLMGEVWEMKVQLRRSGRLKLKAVDDGA